MKYYRMDNLKAAIVHGWMFMYMPGETPRCGLIADNKGHMKILENQPSITREEFERNIPSSNINECIFKALYLKKLNDELVLSN